MNFRDINYYQNRIDTMEGRSSRENHNIVRKLKRQIRNLQKQNKEN
jgi:hypothetical protein